MLAPREIVLFRVGHSGFAVWFGQARSRRQEFRALCGWRLFRGALGHLSRHGSSTKTAQMSRRAGSPVSEIWQACYRDGTLAESAWGVSAGRQRKPLLNCRRPGSPRRTPGRPEALERDSFPVRTRPDRIFNGRDFRGRVSGPAGLPNEVICADRPFHQPAFLTRGHDHGAGIFPSARTCSLDRRNRYALHSRARAEGKRTSQGMPSAVCYPQTL